MRSHKSLRPVGVAMALSVAFAWATVAQAAVVAFENLPGPGHFDWTATAGQEFLNVTLDAASQPGLSGTPATFWRQDFAEGTRIRGASLSSRIEAVTRDVMPGFGAALHVGLPLDAPIPTPVGPDLTGFSVTGFLYYNDSDPGYPHSEIPENEQSYLGVLFNLGSGTQYGWIGVVRTGAEVDAFAWGYETEPGVPIAAGAGIPEPGTISLLLIGAVGVISRRRR